MSREYDDRDADDRDDFDDRPFGGREREEAKGRVKPPAIVMLIFAVLNLVFVPIGIYNYVTLPAMIEEQKKTIDADENMPAKQKQDLKEFWEMYGQILSVALPPSIGLQLVFGLLQLVGSRKMLKMQSRGWGKVTAILNIIPVGNWCCFLGIPVGIWALVVLSRADVMAAFAETAADASAEADGFDDRG